MGRKMTIMRAHRFHCTGLAVVMLCAYGASAGLRPVLAGPEPAEGREETGDGEASFTLREVLARAVARNPTQEMLDARLGEVRALTRQAESLWAADPALEFRYQNDAFIDQDGLLEWEWGVELPLWLPGQRQARHAVAEQAGAAVSASGTALRLTVAGLVREALWDMALEDNQVAVATREHDTAARLERDVGKRVRLGDLARSDLILAQQETLARQAAELRARGEYDNARRRYRVLTGLDAVPRHFKEHPAEARGIGDRHPLLAEATAAVERALAEQVQARREQRASPTLTVGTRHERAASGEDYADSFGALFRVPLGLGSQSAPALARAEVSLAEAQSKREELRRRLDLAAGQAARDLETVRAELDVAERQHGLAQQHLAMAKRSFALGESDLVSLMRVQTLAFGAERTLLQKRLELGLAIAHLNQALGVLP